ncbi:MAG TPA: hypothetical protein VJ965_11845 [Anaerolineales bacterium]|nr:hypothetical protein [Anaerolineales bacterium]
MKKNSRNKLMLIAAVLALMALSCSELTVENKTTNPVRIVVTMPGESVPETILLSEGDSDFFVSDYSGTYTVTAVMDESWRDKLTGIRDELTLMLLGQMGQMDQEEISRITRQLGKIESLLDAEMQPVSCSGSVDDETSGYAVIEVHLSGNGLMISCD